MRISTFAALALASTALRAPDDGGAPAAPAAVDPGTPPGLTEFEFPNLEGKRTFDVGTIPGNVRLDFLKGATRAYIANRLNGLHTRHQKDEKVAAWAAYDAATEADALQSVVAKPTFERPAAPNYEQGFAAAIADLVAGNVRRQSAEPKARKAAKDPLVSIVSEAVAREVYNNRKATDPKVSYLAVKSEVGDGVAYLNALIDAKVEGGAVRADLEKMLAEKYINPAKAMLGINTSKAAAALPSIL